MRNPGRIVVIVLALDTLTSRPRAYPSSVIFAPTGASLEFGEFSAYTYVPINLRPSFGPSASWLGLDAGVVPDFSWTEGLRFGGIELGFDLIHGAEHRDGSSYIKPIFNAKLSALTDPSRTFALALGIMSVAPFQFTESVNLTYVAATKEFEFGGQSYGTLTLGMGYAASASSFAFRGSPPLRDTRLVPLLGYASPEWYGLALYVDSVGGVSETSSTNVAISFSIGEQTELMLGAFFANERDPKDDTVSDGMFAELGVTFEPFTRRETERECARAD